MGPLFHFLRAKNRSKLWRRPQTGECTERLGGTQGMFTGYSYTANPPAFLKRRGDGPISTALRGGFFDPYSLAHMWTSSFLD